MSDIAIRCEGLSKQYRIGKRERYRALRDVLTDAMSAPSARSVRHFATVLPSPPRPVAPSPRLLLSGLSTTSPSR